MIELVYVLMFSSSEYDFNKDEIHNKMWQKCNIQEEKIEKEKIEETLSILSPENKEQSENYQATTQEVGIASYYASCFEGRKTSCGELYCGAELTAAHKTLPFGTLVRVTMLSTGKQVTVKINDRGPYSHKRVIDLSFKAAKTIGLVRAGVSKVKIEVIEEDKG